MLHENLSDFVAVIALKQYQAVFCGSTTCAVTLEFPCQTLKVNTLSVDAFDDSGGFAPFPCLKADLHKLLFHADGAAYAKILWETAGRTDFRHYGTLMLLDLVAIG